jgi:hypothetical protein
MHLWEREDPNHHVVPVADSEVWVAGGSAKPTTAVVELSQADGNPEWFISSVTTCSAAKGVDGSGAASGVPHRVLVEGVDVGNVYVTDLDNLQRVERSRFSTRSAT